MPSGSDPALASTGVHEAGPQRRRARFGHPEDMFQIHEAIQFRLLFGRQTALLLPRNQFGDALLGLGGRVVVGNGLRRCAAAMKSILSRYEGMAALLITSSFGITRKQDHLPMRVPQSPLIPMHVRVRLHATVPMRVHVGVRPDQFGALQQLHIVQYLERRACSHHAPVGKDVAAVRDVFQLSLIHI